jgi:hypothetical protein
MDNTLFGPCGSSDNVQCTPFKLFVEKKFKPDIRFLIVDEVGIADTSENMLCGHFDILEKYKYFLNIKNKVSVTKSNAEFVITIDSSKLGFKVPYLTIYNALRDILIQIYNGTYISDDAIKINDVDWSIKISTIITCISLTFYFGMHYLMEIYIQKMLKSLVIENLLGPKKGVEYRNNFMFIDLFSSELMIGYTDDKCKLMYILENVFNFVFQPNSKYMPDITNLMKHEKTEDFYRDIKKVSVKRVNHIDLYFMTPEMYTKIFEIMKSIGREYEYDNNFYKKFVIPSHKTTDFENPEEVLNLANYIRLLKE